ncbi:MAG: YMGG-like glycine zipper-containing protein [Bacteroidota bacterium]
MKKTLIALVVTAAVVSACNKQDTSSTTVPMQNPFNNSMNGATDGSDYSFAQRIMMESPEYIAWRKEKIEADRLFNEELNAKQEADNETIDRTPATAKKTTKQSSNTNNSNNTNNSTAQNEPSPGTVTPAEQPAKKRWSNRAKGAVIGAGSGAVVGVIVSKDKVKGGILGGLLGAGVGYVIGNEKDKKKSKTN